MAPPATNPPSDFDGTWEFSSAEHAYLGDAAYRGAVGAAASQSGQSGEQTVKLGAACPKIPFGDVVAMAADYFGSIDEMRKLADLPGHGPGTAEELRYVQAVRVHGTAKEASFAKEVIESSRQRSRKLDVANYTHFLNPRAGDLQRPQFEKNRPTGEPDNCGACYLRNHERALKEAYDAGHAKKPSCEEAMACEAFAIHYLTDAFAAGHLRVARLDVQREWDRKEPHFFAKFAAHMAFCIADQIKNHRTEIGAPWYIALAPFSLVEKQARAAIAEVLKSNGIPPVGLGAMLAIAIHDYDNLHGVKARVGEPIVTLYGDDEIVDSNGTLTEKGKPTWAAACETAQLSIADVLAAFAAGQAGQDYQEFLAARQDPEHKMYAAERRLPQVLPDAQQEQPSIPWQDESWQKLFGQAAVVDALKLTGKLKQQELTAMASALEPGFKREAFVRGIVLAIGADPVGFLRAVLLRPNQGG